MSEKTMIQYEQKYNGKTTYTETNELDVYKSLCDDFIRQKRGRKRRISINPRYDGYFSISVSYGDGVRRDYVVEDN